MKTPTPTTADLGVKWAENGYGSGQSAQLEPKDSRNVLHCMHLRYKAIKVLESQQGSQANMAMVCMV